MFEEGIVNRTVYCLVKELGKTKKTTTEKGDELEFAIGVCEDKESGEEFKLILGLGAFAELQEEDIVLLKHFVAKPDKYGEDIFVLSKGLHGQLLTLPKNIKVSKGGLKKWG